jgi:hypothetical protein
MLKTPVTFYDAHTVSHHVKGPGSVVTALTRTRKKRVGEVSTFSWNKIHWGGGGLSVTTAKILKH